YSKRLEDTLSHGRDPEMGYDELHLVAIIGEDLDALEKRIPELKKVAVADPQGGPLADQDKKFRETIEHLAGAANDLVGRIFQAEHKRILEAKKDYRNTLWTIIASSVFGVLFLCGLLQRFYGWVFYPIRDLEQGAGRVARGDFDFRIEVHSGDELEDLAA